MTNNHRTRSAVAGKLICLFSVLALSSRLAFAQAPSGELTFHFDPTTTPLIDLSGGIPVSQNISGVGGTPVPIAFTMSLTNLASGQLRSATTNDVTILQIGNDFVAARTKVSGNVTGGGTRPIRVSLTVQLSGEDDTMSIAPGIDVVFKISLRYDLFFNANDGLLHGSVKGSANFKHLGTGKINDSIDVPLPGGIDGSWDLALNVIPLSKLTGVGFITLPNGRVLQTKLNGSFATKILGRPPVITGVSKIKLSGVAPDKGVTVTIGTSQTPETDIELDTIRGRVLGQTLLE